MFDNLIALEELTTLICACQFNKLATKMSVLRTGNQVQVPFQLSINSLPLATFVRVVTPHWLFGTTQNNMLSPDLLIAVNTFDFNKPTTFIFHPRFRILVQVLVKLTADGPKGDQLFCRRPSGGTAFGGDHLWYDRSIEVGVLGCRLGF